MEPARGRSSDGPVPLILHLDLDCFYAQCELHRLGLPLDSPLAVQQWGGLLAVSYSARPFGVKRGMRVEQALALCPGLHVPHVDTIGVGSDEAGHTSSSPPADRAVEKVSLDYYRSVSSEIFSLLEGLAPQFERASIDEAFVNVTEEAASEVGRMQSSTDAWAEAAGDGEGVWQPDPTLSLDVMLVAAAAVCSRLRAAVKSQLGYDISAGIAHTKMLAKLASARNKPDKQTIVPTRAVPALLASVPLRSLRGLGGKLGEQVASALPNVSSVGELAAVEFSILLRHFGRETADWLRRASTGDLHEAVKPNGLAPKSLNAYKSFSPTADEAAIMRLVRLLAAELVERCEADEKQHGRVAKTLKVSWRGELRNDHLHNWTAGRVSALTPTSSKQGAMPGAGRRNVDTVVESALKLLPRVGGGEQLTRLGLSAADFVPLAARSVAAMLAQPSLRPPRSEAGAACTLATTTVPRAGRVVLHLDCDNFYVGVERVDDPTLRGRPVAVTQGNSGGIVALSDEAKAAGLRKGDGVGAQGRAQIERLVQMGSISLDECREKCPGLAVRPMRTDRYREAGQAVLEAIQDACGHGIPVEKTSYDDFYIDASAMVAAAATQQEAHDLGRVRIWPDAESDAANTAMKMPDDLLRACTLANQLRGAVRQRVGLIASVGVGRTKLVARMLSPRAKPDGVVAVADENVVPLMVSHDIQRLPGLQQKKGREISAKLAATVGSADGSVTLAEVVALPRDALSRAVGAADAALLLRCAKGDDGGAAVVPRGPVKALASEISFPPTADGIKLEEILHGLSEKLWRRLRDDHQQNRRTPARLLVGWRIGYGEGGGGMHSHSIAFPLGLAASLRSGADESGEASAEAVASLTRAASSIVYDRLSRRPPPLTRLIVTGQFADSGGSGLGGVGTGSSNEGALKRMLDASTTAPTKLVTTAAPAAPTPPREVKIARLASDTVPSTSAGSPADHDWNCAACTLLNEATANRCAICGALRGSTLAAASTIAAHQPRSTSHARGPPRKSASTTASSSSSSSSQQPSLAAFLGRK